MKKFILIITLSFITISLTESQTLKIKEVKEFAKKILPDAVDFKAESFKKIDYFIGYNEKKEKVGLIILIHSEGYKSIIKLVVGIDMNCKVVNYIILSHDETSEYIENVLKDEKFPKQFKGKKSEELILKKDDLENGKIDTVTGATISSRAITEGVRYALKIAEKILKPQQKSKE